MYDVKARDPDSGYNGVVEYMFVHEGEESVRTPEFQINPITGVIQAEIIYDREKVDRYVVCTTVHHNLVITPLVGSKAKTVLAKQSCCIQTEIYRLYRKMTIN